VIDEDQVLGSVRDRLLERYLGFAFGGLHFALRDISAEIAEARRMMAEFLGREVQLPNRASRLLHLWVLSDETDEIVGHATREVGARGSALVVAHKQLRIQPQWRRQGFGSALLAANRDWYRECGVAFIVMEAEGDGSAFAAVRGFDFDLMSYAKRPGFEGLTERELRFAAVDRLIRHPVIQDTVDGGQAQPREALLAFRERLRALGAEPARQVDRFEARLPQPVAPASQPVAPALQPVAPALQPVAPALQPVAPALQPVAHGQGAFTGDARTFTAPHEIAAFGQDEPLEVLGGASLGPALLALTGWSGITTA
jgi:GNAT superfamily N-acetyltransferase